MTELKHFFRLFHTIKYIKFEQIYFQIWYRFKNIFLNIEWYKKYLDQSLSPVNSKVDVILFNKGEEFKFNNTFSFIGLSHNFDDQINWNFKDHGKLWNYNLQYFNYLLDESIPVNKRTRLLQDFSKELLSNNIKLEPYPTSLRIINSLIFINRHSIIDHIIDESLKRQIDYLSSNLEKHILANHLLENIFTIYISSFSLSNKALNIKSSKLLLNQLNEQILSDGAHYERSPMYHSIILGKLLLCIDIAENNGETNDLLINSLREKASQMLGWINAFSFPDGSWALMNDAAENIAPTTQQLNKAATLLDIQWQNSTLSDSGYRKLIGKKWELIANVGNITPAYQPGHTHADMLNFCIWHNGKQLVVDPGTSTYNISKQRNWERSTVAHNTISINNFNQSDIWGGFRVGKRAKCTLINADTDSIEASHNGYTHYGVLISRIFKIIKDDLQITDIVYFSKNKSNLKIDGNMLFNHSSRIQISDNDVLIDDVKISYNQKPILTEAYFANSFNKLKPTKALAYSVDKSVNFIFKFS